MNRTIKFRAWLGNVMHPVWERIDEGVYETHPDIKIMQFTGLYDRNEKPIYEDDVLKRDDDDSLWTVWFDTAVMGCWMASNYCTNSQLLGESFIQFTNQNAEGNPFIDAEIVGNVHENPVLVK